MGVVADAAPAAPARRPSESGASPGQLFVGAGLAGVPLASLVPAIEALPEEVVAAATGFVQHLLMSYGASPEASAAFVAQVGQFAGAFQQLASDVLMAAG